MDTISYSRFSDVFEHFQPGNHLCCIYATEEEHRAVLTPFLRQGLERGEKVLYIVDAHTAEVILGYLRDEGVDVEACLERGQFAILTRDDAYMREGVFDPERMIALLRAETERALAEGYPALRATGEMSWALRGLPGSERLIEYEARLNEFFPGSQCLAICQYDRRRFDAALLLDVLRTHPIAVIGTEVYDNFYYVPPAEFLSEYRAAVELQRREQNLARRKRAEEALRESQQLLERTFASLYDAVFIIDAATTEILDCNPAASHIFGYSREEMVGQTTAFLHVDQAALEEFRAHLYPAVEEKGFLFLPEFRMKRKDGTVFPTEHNVMPLEDEHGRRIGWVSVVRDITAGKRAEEALQRRTEELAALQATVLEIIAPHDLPTLLQTIIERAARLLHAPGGGLYLCDPDRQEARCVVSYNTPRDYTGTVLKYGEGAAGVVAQTGEPLIIDDYRIWSGRAVVYDEEQPFRAVLSAPMIWQDQVTGVIHVLHYEEGRRFTKADLELLTLFANHAAIALENARLLEETRQRAAEAAALLEISLTLNTLDLDSTLRTIGERARAFFAADGCRVFLLEPDGETLRCVLALHQRAEAVLAMRIKLGQGVTGDVARRGEAEIVNDMLGDPRSIQVPGTPVEKEAMMFAPLKERERVIGVMSVSRLGDKRPFQPADLELLKAFASMASSAISNARLFGETRRLKEFNESVVQSMAEGIFIEDAEGGCIFANPAAAEMLGYTHEELVGQHWTAIVPPDQQPIVQAANERRMRGESDRYELELVRKDATRISVLVSGSPRFEDGRFAGTLAVFTDITERRRAEEEIRQRTAQLEALRQVSLELTAQLDLDILLHSIVSRAIELLDATSGGFYLYRPDRDVLEWAIAVGLDPALIGTILHRGEGLSGKVWETGQPLIVDDYQHWEGRAAVYEGYPFKATIGTPVRWGEEFLGVLNLLADPPHTFSPSDAELLSLFAAQAAIAIQNARLFQAEAQRRREAETLQAATLALSATLGLQQVFEAILRELRKVVPYDSASVQQLKGDRLEIIGGHGFPNLEELLGVSFDLKARDNPNREVIHTRAPLILEDAPAVYEEFGREPHAQAGIRSWLGVPLLFGDRLIGMITLDKREPGFYTKDHARLAMAFAAQAAIAIENAHLYEEAHRRAERLAVVNRIARAASATLHLDELMETVYREVTAIFEADAFFIALYDEETRELDHRLRVDEGIREPRERRPLGTGLTSLVVSEKRSLLIRDFEKEKEHLPEARLWGTMKTPASWLGVPMLIGDRVVGVISVQAYASQAYSEEDEQLLSTIADQTAIALENARLFEAEQSRRRQAEELGQRLQALQALSTSLTTAHTMTEVLHAIQVGITTILPDALPPAFALTDEAAGVLRVLPDTLPAPLTDALRRTPGDRLEWFEFPLDESRPAIQALRRGELAISGDAVEFYGHVVPASLVRSAQQALGVRTIVHVPLRVKERLVGVMGTATQREGLSADDRTLLTAFAHQAAIAIENARLYEQTRRRAEELHLLFEAARDASSSLELDKVLERVAARLCQAAGATSGHILMLDEKGERATVRAQYWSPEASPRERTPDIGTVYDLTRHPTILQALQENRPMVTYVDDPNLEQVTRDMMADFDGRSALRIPMHVTGVLHGYALIWDSRRRHEWTDEEVRLCQTLANQLAIAIEKARLFEREQEQRKLAEALEQAAAVISSTLDPDQVLDLILEQVSRVVPNDAANIMLIKGDQVRIVRWRGYERFAAEEFVSTVVFRIPEVANLRQMLESREPMVIPDTATYPGWVDFPSQRWLRSYAAAPIVVRGEVIGFLNVDSATPGFFTQAHAEALRAFADHAAAAIENARLYEEMQRYSEHLAELVEERTAELKRTNEQLAREIAERRQAQKVLAQLNEELIERARKLEAVNKELETFSYSVSHDLRAPLRAIDGFSRILLEDYAAQLPAEAQRYLRLVRDSTQHMGQLIDDLLAFSRLGRLPLNKQPVAPTDIVHLAWEDLQRERGARQVELRIGDLPACQADPLLLRQVFVNLLDNALKFTRVREVAVIEVGCREEGGEPVYFVKDNGVGFDMRYADKLFGVFQRLHRAEEYEGTGVGLAVVQHIIHRHGGRVWAEAEVDKGATFYLTLGRGTPDGQGHRGDPAGRR